MTKPLPIYEVKDQLVEAIATTQKAVLVAPTGSGKSTQVPQILRESNITDKTIAVLQPRRLAARSVARRVAQEMGTPLGDVVGFTTRHEHKTSTNTRIHFMTEGVLLRMWQGDPTLANIGAIILDEFHERSIHADLILSLASRLQTQRPDLSLVVMSATLQRDTVATFLDAPIVESKGRSFPVTIKHDEGADDAPIWDRAAKGIKQLIRNGHPGDALVFMPGVFEIRKTIEAINKQSLGESVTCMALFGEQTPEEQDDVFNPNPKRKIIVATNVAETSITIDGIRMVIDSGQARVNRYDHGRGLNSLQLEPISRSSADQRSGRAGRTADGICLRLWRQYDHQRRDAFDTPELHRTDLAPTVLTLAKMGINDPANINWLEPPLEQPLVRAQTLLQTLGAITPNGSLTELGDAMSRLPMHPRLARMIIASDKRGCLQRICLWAALCSERSIWRKQANPKRDFPLPKGAWPSDMLIAEQAIAWAASVNFRGHDLTARGIQGTAVRAVLNAAKQYNQVAATMGLRDGGIDEIEPAMLCLLSAFADHVGAKPFTGSAVCQLSHQRSGSVSPQSICRDQRLIVTLDIQEVGQRQGSKTHLNLVSAVEQDWLEALYPEALNTHEMCTWQEDTKSVVSTSEVHFFDVCIERSAAKVPQHGMAAPILTRKLLNQEIQIKHWNESLMQWMDRVRCVAEWHPDRELITYSNEDIELLLQEAFHPFSKLKEIRDLELLDTFKYALDYKDVQLVEACTPTSLDLVTGRKLRITYQPGKPPVGRAKIQELYDTHDTPRVNQGKTPILVEILGPNYRPVQLTQDMGSFWENTYPQVKKDLKRRYPKNEWR